jgi:uncharacterized membrane protein
VRTATGEVYESSVNDVRLNLGAILIIAAATLVLGLPMLIYGPHPLAHDTYEHLAFNRYFSEQFWSGNWYPRWLVQMNHKLGSPSFFVFPPFQAFVYAFLEPFSRVLHFNAFRIEELVVLFLSGLSALLWLSTFCERRVATMTSILYMVAPYHLEIDFYRRTALPECWALVCAPLLMYCTTRIIEDRRASVVCFAAVYGIFILCHLISVALVSPIPVAAVLFFSEEPERRRSLAKTIAGMALGAGLSGFYLLPALRQARYFPPWNYIPPVSRYLIGLGNLSIRFPGSPVFHLQLLGQRVDCLFVARCDSTTLRATVKPVAHEAKLSCR